jgi:hypothetical protein
MELDSIGYYLYQESKADSPAPNKFFAIYIDHRPQTLFSGGKHALYRAY